MKILAALVAVVSLGTSAFGGTERKEIATRGEWSISTCKVNGRDRGAEMCRTYNAKQEVHLRLRVDQGGVFLQAAGDWSALSQAATQRAEFRLNSAKGAPLWVGTARVIKDDDGLPWLSLDLGKSVDGDATERVLEAMMERGKVAFIEVGKAPDQAEWSFDLKGAKEAYDAMWEYLQESGAAGVK
jgi:hypothetical protein